jgi:protein TonB
LIIGKILMVLSSLTGRWADRRATLVAFFIATTAHAGVYQHFSAMKSNSIPANAPPPVVSVSLVAAPASVTEPELEPQPVVTPAPKPAAKVPVAKPTPEPVKKKRVARPEPTATPVAQPQPVEVAASRVPVVESEPAMIDLPVILPRADAAYLKNPPPKYPRVMLRRGIEGTVMVSAQVFDDGSCHHVKLKESSGHRLLDEAALAAVKSWQFVPARKGDENIVAWVDIPIDFRITRRQ